MTDSYETYETIYGEALRSFAVVFDYEYYRDGLDVPIMRDDVRETWEFLRDDMDDRFPDMDSADIRSAIRDAASELRIPDEWTD